MNLPARLVRIFAVTPSVSYPPAYWFCPTDESKPLREYCVRRDNHNQWYGYKMFTGQFNTVTASVGTKSVVLPLKMTEKLIAIAMFSEGWAG